MQLHAQALWYIHHVTVQGTLPTCFVQSMPEEGHFTQLLCPTRHCIWFSGHCVHERKCVRGSGEVPNVPRPHLRQLIVRSVLSGGACSVPLGHSGKHVLSLVISLSQPAHVFHGGGGVGGGNMGGGNDGDCFGPQSPKSCQQAKLLHAGSQSPSLR